GRVCVGGERCVEGTRCGEGGDCPVGRRCVGEICLADPRAAGGLAAEPDVLAFTFAQVGDEAARAVVLQNVGDAVLEVVELEFLGSATFAISEAPPLPIRLVPAQQREVIVRYRADDLQPDQGVLRVHTGTGGSVDVRLLSDAKETGQAAPCLRVQPAALAFGAVARGSDRVLPFEMVSCGTVPVTVQGIQRGVTFFGPLSANFDLVAPPAFPLRLDPGARQAIDVRYTPQRAGLEGGFWEVASDDRQSPLQRVDVNAIATPPPLEDVALHIRVSWDTDLTDVDTHVLGPGGQAWTCAGDCYFSNPNPDWGQQGRFEDDPFLDLDDVDGFGPENVNIAAPANGTYRVIAQYWDSHGGNDPNVTVEILSFNNVVARYGPVRLRASDDEWDVVDIDWPGLVLRPLGNQVVNRPRGPLCGGF
ncbi:MAG: choice-of-anchor D domain-containing protein, partial [Myxococcales bacterium]|nr:choice-of-anchor D domain-containing protein [Myxococcales bacterium]